MWKKFEDFNVVKKRRVVNSFLGCKEEVSLILLFFEGLK